MTARKLLIALLGVAVFWGQSALSGGWDITASEATGGVTLVLAALFTWLVPNTRALTTAKTWVNALGTGSVLLQSLLPGGFTTDEMWKVLILVLTTAGVYLVPNVDKNWSIPAEPEKDDWRTTASG